MINEIIINPDGCRTLIGSLACRFVSKLELPKVCRLSDDEKFFVFEVTPEDKVICRAGQSTRDGAMRYMAPNRVLVWRDA